MKHETMEKIEKLICKELDIIAEERGDLDERTEAFLDNLLHSMKSLECVKEKSEEGYSGRRSMDGYARAYDASYDDGNSFARRRDRMGRYSRTGGAEEKLRMMMDDTDDPKEREALEHALRAMR